tara:strand:+ start:3884 stop:5338 length:1455 start_codon:yes stop_codon:yes gene_type:complete
MNILKSASWVFSRVIFIQLLNIISISIIARIITPEAFGLVAIATIIITFLNNICIQGVSHYVIYDKNLCDKKFNSIFWLNIVITFIICVLGFISSKYVSIFYNEPELELIINILLLKIPLESIISLLDSSINKKLEFKILEKRDIYSQFLSVLMSIILALAGYGIWALILPSVIVAFIRLPITFYISKWKPKMNFYVVYWKEIFSYSYKVISNIIIYFLTSEGDTLIIGKIMGSYKLGVYNISWRASNLVSRNIVSLVNKLAFPYIAKSTHDNFETISKLNKIFRHISLISFPILFLLFVLADNFILAIYGSQWHESIIPFQILIIYAIRYSVGAPIGPFLNAIGKPEILTKMGLIMIPFYIIAILIGTSYGIIGVAIAVTFVRTIFGFGFFFILSKILKTHVLSFFKEMQSSFLVSLITCTIIFIIKLLFEDFLSDNHLINLSVLSILASLIYYILIKTFFKDIFSDIKLVLNKIYIKNLNQN